MPFPAGIVMHGYMLWVAIGYSLLGSLIAHRLGRPLVALNGEQQQVEADFRHALVQRASMPKRSRWRGARPARPGGCIASTRYAPTGPR